MKPFTSFPATPHALLAIALASAALPVMAEESGFLEDAKVNLNLRKKRPVIANVAVARELAGWCWSLAVLPD